MKASLSWSLLCIALIAASLDETPFHQVLDAFLQRCSHPDMQGTGEGPQKDVAPASKEYGISPACQLIDDGVQAIQVNLRLM